MVQQHETGPTFAEDIRLVIWDLDETFWDGTLTEGGITYRDDHHQLVISLAQRGIMSSICSKNDPAQIEDLLKEKGLWPYCIFPSIDWTPKGPRIKAMLEEIGLRARSVLFIDDNPMNLAQAVHMNPGLNVAAPEIIASLEGEPQLQGKPDRELIRLEQYKLKESKRDARVAMQGDTVAFLRQSQVRVYIEHDVEAHIDRAVELINRTNQLNFTKLRLDDDPVIARSALLDRLSHNTTDAGLIRVRDNFGDYGFVGFYLTRRRAQGRQLEHFCFSCRTLNMYIEHWLYDFLDRPGLEVSGEVLSDPVHDHIRPDWITPAPIEMIQEAAALPMQRYDRIFARGGCDLASLMHYFRLHTDTLIEEFNFPKNGQIFRRDHSAFLMPVLERPLKEDEVWAAHSLGYDRCDFGSEILEASDQRTLYFLSFWADSDIPLYRHKETGLCLPYWLVGAQQHDLIAREDLRAAVCETDLHMHRTEMLARDFEHLGLLTNAELTERYTTILAALPQTARVILVLANERGPKHFQNPQAAPHPHHQRLNMVLRDVAGARKNVILIDPAKHISGEEDVIDLNHFKRPVYHRMYKEVLRRLSHLENCQSEESKDEQQ